MYVCVCNAVTESQVHASVAAGASSLADLQFDLGVATCCGCCADTASEYLPGGTACANKGHCEMQPPVMAVAQPGTLAANGYPVVKIARAA